MEQFINLLTILISLLILISTTLFTGLLVSIYIDKIKELNKRTKNKQTK